MSSRHNRTLLSVGRTAHDRIQRACVVVIGMNPVGAEAAKVMLLMGVNRLVMCDAGSVDLCDIGGNMFVRKEDIGKRRDRVLSESMKRLNPVAEIECVDEERVDEAIKNATVVVFAKQACFEEICRVNRLCRDAGVGFVLGDCYSFSGFVFIDFGEKFVVENLVGKPPEKYRIDAISNANPGVIRFAGRQQPELARDCLVEFQGLESMTELNDMGPIPMHYEDYIATLGCDTSSFSKFDRVNRKGFAVIVKPPQEKLFSSYDESLDSSFHSTLFTDRHSVVREFFVNRQKSKNRNSYYEPATTTLIAGLMANEAIKCITHHLVPMQRQWFLYMRDELFEIPDHSLTPDITGMKVAVIGVGATGCETAKLLALSGVKKLTLVDPDNIETTNLNRQVLFTDSDVGSNKAEAAKATLKFLRPNLNIEAYSHFVNEETESLFTEEWFQQFDAVFAMVDSFLAREYIDSRCAPVKVPMFSGGIDKTSADWQAVVPNVTPRYGHGMVHSQNNNTTPSCTLKLFPYKPEHCIEWAHHQLNRILTKSPDVTTFDQCVRQALDFVIAKFILRIKDLQYFHPKDERVNGALYWTTHRIYPTELELDTQNTYIRQLVTAFSKLVAKKHGIPESPIDFASLHPKFEWTPPDESMRTAFADDTNTGSAVTENHFDHDNEVHIDFIEAASNLRSMNYALGTIDRLYAQMIAGKIDATVSTTASICAAGSFTEFLISRVDPELVQRGKFVSSPFSLMTFRESQTPKSRLGNSDEMFTPWDFLRFEGTETLKSVQQQIETRAKCEIGIWSTSDGFLLPLEGRPTFGKAIPTSSTFNDVFKDRGSRQIAIEVCLEDENLVLPPVLINLHKSDA